MNLKEAAASAASTMAKQAEAILALDEIDNRSWTFETNWLTDKTKFTKLLADIKAWGSKNEPRIYLFSCLSTTDLPTIQSAFSSAKATEAGNRAYARLNSPSNVFYVGGSSALSKRVSEHLGFGHKSTYAMHLAQWIQPFPLQLEIRAARFSSDTDRSLVQVLEDALWLQLRPMFGRKGHQ